MCTIPLDSSFVNAIVFIVVDVICFMLIISNFFHHVHAAHVARRLRNGATLHLRESRMSAFLPSILCDNHSFTRFLQLSYFVTLAVVFALTLSINGETIARQTAVHPRYLTHLQPASHLYNAPRLDPAIFSACTVRNAHSLLYFPTAFDTVRNDTIADRRALLTRAGLPIAIDPNSVACQNFGNVRPLIRLSPCGTRRSQCDNFFGAASATYRVLPRDERAAAPWRRPFRARAGNRRDGLLQLRLNVRRNGSGGGGGGGGDDRLICVERPMQGSRSSPLFAALSCVLGAWRGNGSAFSLRVGAGAVSLPTWRRHLRAGTAPPLVAFRPFSARVRLRWAAARGAEDALADALALLRENAVTAREFVDGAVARAVVVRDAPPRARLLRAAEASVTRVKAAGAWGYAALLVAAAVLQALQCATRRRGALVLDDGAWRRARLDVTDYGGLLTVVAAAGGGHAMDSARDGVSFVMDDGVIRPLYARRGSEGGGAGERAEEMGGGGDGR